MEILREIEDGFEALSQPQRRTVFEVNTEFDKHSLIDVQQGIDFLMGQNEEGVIFIPIASVREMFGFEPAGKTEVLLADLLTKQKAPVRIHYRLLDQKCSAWLLSINDPWLRLAHPQGVVSVPLANLEFAQVSPKNGIRPGLA